LDLLAIVFYVFFRFTTFDYPLVFPNVSSYFWDFVTTEDEIDETPCIGHYQCIRVIWQELVVGRWFSPGTQVSSTNIADRHDISDILVESGFKHHNPNPMHTAVYCLVSLISMKSRSKTLTFILITVSCKPSKVR
jgi:hypothetical protein